MSDTITLTYPQGKMLTYDAAVALEALVADLRQGVVTGPDVGGSVRISLPRAAKLEIEFKAKEKPGKRKQKLSIELSWKEEDAPTEEPAATQAPCAVAEASATEE